MGRFNYTLGKGKDVQIGDETFTIRQLNARNLALFLDEKQDKAESMFKMVLASLQQTDETITMADIDEMPLPVFQQVAEAVMEVNELKE